MSRRKVLVVGGGPAGMMAAGRAAEMGAEVLLLEKMGRPGRKLGITGKGRCNLTNVAELPEFLAHFGKSGQFLRQAFARFFNRELMTFFEGLGLPLVTERGGRVFPASGKAMDLLQVLMVWLAQGGVKVETGLAVEELLLRDNRCLGVRAGGREILAEAVILATGGASYPATGSTGDGYRLATAAGHRTVAIRPALVPLETAGSLAARMAEANLRNVKVTLLIAGKKRREEFGELVFAKFGVSGPTILTLSGAAVDALEAGQKVELLLDLKPALDEAKLEARLLRDFASRGQEPFASVLRGLLPKETIPACLEELAIAGTRLANTITAPERKRLRSWLKELRLEVTKPRSFAEAIVTAGGVATREIDPHTMASRLLPGLYLAGELLDLQADTGGFNLQAAFSTGWLAGEAAAVGAAAKTISHRKKNNL